MAKPLQVLGACEETVQKLEIAASDDAQLAAADLASITGPVPPVTPELKDGGSGEAFLAFTP